MSNNADNKTSVASPDMDLDALHHQLSVEMQQHDYAGPVPPPDIVEKYETLVPGAAERFMQCYEKEQHHHHRIIEKTVAISEFDTRQRHTNLKRGQYFALIVFILLVAGIISCALIGSDTGMLVFGGLSIASIMTAFLKSKS